MNDDKAEKTALFRYGLIAPLVLETLPRGELTRRAQEIAARLYDIPHSTRRHVSVDTLLEWTLRYRRHGLAALTPKPRQDRGQQRAIAPETAALIERLKRANPHRTGTALLRELASSSEQDMPDGFSPSTLYRFLRARRLHRSANCSSIKPPPTKSMRRSLPIRTWQSDMLFGPWVQRTGGGKMQVFLQATLDDASRLIPHAQFYPQSGVRFVSRLPAPSHRRARGSHPPLHGQRQDIPLAATRAHRRLHRHPHHSHTAVSARRTWQDRAFLPFGARAVTASLDPKALLSLEQLNEQLWHWLDTVYHRHQHSALETTPLLRWQRDIEKVRQLPPDAEMRRVCSFTGSIVWSAATPPSCCVTASLKPPSQFGRQKIEVRFDPLDLEHVEIYCDGNVEGAAHSGGRGR